MAGEKKQIGSKLAVIGVSIVIVAAASFLFMSYYMFTPQSPMNEAGGAASTQNEASDDPVSAQKEIPAPPSFSGTVAGTSNASEAGGGPGGSAQSNGDGGGEQVETSPYSIFYTCPEDQNPYIQLYETAQKQIIYAWSDNPNCVDELTPYNMVLTKSPTHINVKFYDGRMENSYGFTNPTKILNLYAQDFQNFNFIDTVELQGDAAQYFSIDSYTVDEIWTGNPENGTATLERKILNIKLAVDDAIPTFSWKRLKLYVADLTMDYYLGDVWFYSQ